jgi:hypothetical protein
MSTARGNYWEFPPKILLASNQIGKDACRTVIYWHTPSAANGAGMKRLPSLRILMQFERSVVLFGFIVGNPKKNTVRF